MIQGERLDSAERLNELGSCAWSFYQDAGLRCRAASKRLGAHGVCWVVEERDGRG